MIDVIKRKDVGEGWKALNIEELLFAIEVGS